MHGAADFAKCENVKRQGSGWARGHHPVAQVGSLVIVYRLREARSRRGCFTVSRLESDGIAANRNSRHACDGHPTVPSGLKKVRGDELLFTAVSARPK